MLKTADITLARRIEAVKPSATLAVAAKAEGLLRAGRDIINLSVGEPDFDTPVHIKEGAIRAIQAGHTKYTAVDGIPLLKEAIVEKFKRENQLVYQPNQIIVSSGAKHSLFNLFTVLLNPGDEVIIPAPYWTSYPEMITLFDAKPIIVKTTLNDHFKLSPDQLTRVITKRTRLIILNSPTNPTGMAYSKDELAALATVLIHHPHILIASDDIYEHHLWQHLPFSNIVNAYPELYNRTLVINGVSKTYAMTGWRIGYAAGPKEIISAMKKAQSQSTSNPCSISQYAALAALTGDQQCVSQMTKAYHERHNYLVGEIKKIRGFEVLPSDGTFYSFPSVEKLCGIRKEIDSDITFAEYLLNEAGVAVVPGSAFGASKMIRLSYATKMDHLKEAIIRIKNAIQSW